MSSSPTTARHDARAERPRGDRRRPLGHPRGARRPAAGAPPRRRPRFWRYRVALHDAALASLLVTGWSMFRFSQHPEGGDARRPGSTSTLDRRSNGPLSQHRPVPQNDRPPWSCRASRSARGHGGHRPRRRPAAAPVSSQDVTTSSREGHRLTVHAGAVTPGSDPGLTPGVRPATPCGRARRCRTRRSPSSSGPSRTCRSASR